MKRLGYIAILLCLMLGLIFVATVAAAPGASSAALWRSRTPTRTKTKAPTRTPTRTITPTPGSNNLPDLVITAAYWTYDAHTPGTCYSSPPKLHFVVTVTNSGPVDAGAFLVDQDGLRQVSVGGLAAGQSVDLWFPFLFGTPPNSTWPTGSTVFTADSANQVAEGNETNNTRTVPQVAFTPTPAGPTLVYCTVTPSPTFTPTRTPTQSQGAVTGSVLVGGGACCVGGTAGTTINIPAAFSASSTAGSVTQMRVTTSYGGGCASSIGSAWEPFVASKSFPVTVVINFVGFYVSVQYQDSAGNLSAVYCDDISVEGSSAPPTNMTPSRTPSQTPTPTRTKTKTPTVTGT